MASHTTIVARARVSIISEVVFVFAIIVAIGADVRSVEGLTGTRHVVLGRAYQPAMQTL